MRSGPPFIRAWKHNASRLAARGCAAAQLSASAPKHTKSAQCHPQPVAIAHPLSSRLKLDSRLRRELCRPTGGPFTPRNPATSKQSLFGGHGSSGTMHSMHCTVNAPLTRLLLIAERLRAVCVELEKAREHRNSRLLKTAREEHEEAGENKRTPTQDTHAQTERKESGCAGWLIAAMQHCCQRSHGNEGIRTTYTHKHIRCDSLRKKMQRTNAHQCKLDTQ